MFHGLPFRLGAVSAVHTAGTALWGSPAHASLSLSSPCVDLERGVRYHPGLRGQWKAVFACDLSVLRCGDTNNQDWLRELWGQNCPLGVSSPVLCACACIPGLSRRRATWEREFC